MSRRAFRAKLGHLRRLSGVADFAWASATDGSMAPGVGANQAGCGSREMRRRAQRALRAAAKKKGGQP